MRRRIRIRKDEAGFGLVELTIAMMLLSIGVLTIFATFSSSSVALQRAGRTSTASVLADRQLEVYRGLQYSAVLLDLTEVTTESVLGSVYRNDPAWAAVQETQLNCATVPASACDPVQPVAGPDGRAYRIDTYITEQPVAGGREVRQVTVVVRDNEGGTPGQILARQASTFDQLTR
jgi:type II secretory pathway pseudopilin PulG